MKMPRTLLLTVLLTLFAFAAGTYQACRKTTQNHFIGRWTGSNSCQPGEVSELNIFEQDPSRLKLTFNKLLPYDTIVEISATIAPSNDSFKFSNHSYSSIRTGSAVFNESNNSLDLIYIYSASHSAGTTRSCSCRYTRQ